jgi:cytoskeletal protein RodZ
MFPVILAHGALGPFDEIILIGVAIAFIGMMGFSWWRSRHEFDEEEPTSDSAASSSDDGQTVSNRDSAETTDHFRLD